MKKFLIIFLSVLIFAPTATFAGNVQTSIEKTESSYKPGKGKKGFNYRSHAKKGAKLQKGASKRLKKNGGDMTKSLCHKRK